MSSSDQFDKRCLEILKQIIIALKSFEGKFEKKLNFSKLANYLRLNEREAAYILNFLIEVQDELKAFRRIFKDHELYKKQENGNVYLATKRIYKKIPKTIYVKKKHAGWLSDLIYAFQHVKKGKGFNLSNNDAEMLKHIRLLMECHPYFFEKYEKDLVYPSRLASELGNALLKCKKLNRPLDSLNIGVCNIEVER